MSELLIPDHYEQSLQTEIRESLGQWHDDVTALLPTLPPDIDIQFDDEYLTPHFGTGGAAWDLRTLKLAYNPNFDARHDELMEELRATYYHEAYHLARSFSFATTPHDLPALKLAIEEGSATKFEMVHAGSKPGYGLYNDRATMQAWLTEVQELPGGFDYDWKRWKFYDPETGRKWILYKVGMFVVDEALKNNSEITIEGLSALNCDEIFRLSRL